MPEMGIEEVGLEISEKPQKEEMGLLFLCCRS
jgi:hypothetical protein